MTDSLPIPYKDKYTLGEFWETLTRSAPWRGYSLANPNEAAALDMHAKRLIDQEGGTLPSNLAHTHFGNALLMAICTMPTPSD